MSNTPKLTPPADPGPLGQPASLDVKYGSQAVPGPDGKLWLQTAVIISGRPAGVFLCPLPEGPAPSPLLVARGALPPIGAIPPEPIRRSA